MEAPFKENVLRLCSTMDPYLYYVWVFKMAPHVSVFQSAFVSSRESNFSNLSIHSKFVYINIVT